MVDESGRLDYTRAAHALNRTMGLVDLPFDQRILYIPSFHISSLLYCFARSVTAIEYDISAVDVGFASRLMILYQE